jgi:hypothetical protein
VVERGISLSAGHCINALGESIVDILAASSPK